MAGRKNFTAPIWWMIVMIFIQSLLLYTYYTTYDHIIDFNDYEGVKAAWKAIYIQQLIIVVVLIAEVIIYAYIRKRIVKRKWAWLYTLTMLGAMVVLPIIHTGLSLYLGYYQPPEVSSYWAHIAYQVQVVLFWSLTILAHLFFFLMLRNVILHKEVVIEQHTSDKVDILNDY